MLVFACTTGCGPFVGWPTDYRETLANSSSLGKGQDPPSGVQLWMLCPDGRYSREERRIAAGRPGFTVVKIFMQNSATGKIYECSVQIKCDCGAASMRYVSDTALDWEAGLMIYLPPGIGTYFDWLYYGYTLLSGSNPLSLDQVNLEIVRLKGGGSDNVATGYDPARHWKYVANAKHLRLNDTMDTEDESQATETTGTGVVHQANSAVVGDDAMLQEVLFSSLEDSCKL